MKSQRGKTLSGGRQYRRLRSSRTLYQSLVPELKNRKPIAHGSEFIMKTFYSPKKQDQGCVAKNIFERICLLFTTDNQQRVAVSRLPSALWYNKSTTLSE